MASHTSRQLPLSPPEFQILLALADGEKHGYAIMQEFHMRTEGRTGRDWAHYTAPSNACSAMVSSRRRRNALISSSTTSCGATIVSPMPAVAWPSPKRSPFALGSRRARETTADGTHHPWPSGEGESCRQHLDSLPLSIYLYRLMLAAYPIAFRQEYGEAMAQLFRDTARDAYQRARFSRSLGVVAADAGGLHDQRHPSISGQAGALEQGIRFVA